MRIMDHETPAKRTIRRDGWTPERKEQFLELLAAGMGARWACGKVGLSHTAAYNLRRRDPAFARDWRDAQRAARLCAEDRFMAMLSAGIRSKMAELSGESQLHGAGAKAQDTVRVVAQA
jgi:hypothetical protein